MKIKELPEDFREVLEGVTNKRARFVIDTILDKGFCMTEDLKTVDMNTRQEQQEMYGNLGYL